ncbi:toxin-antitoxin system HicB family antitoxin [Serratia marcescens]|uniref:toxin-antitoxin system HicB family antitoxin n=1 Tax=Serratia marcescens TaxID=615 RepID=UPI003C7B6709
MSTILRDKSPKGAGKAPMFNVRISPDLKEQFEIQAKKEGVSLGTGSRNLAGRN